MNTKAEREVQPETVKPEQDTPAPIVSYHETPAQASGSAIRLFTASITLDRWCGFDGVRLTFFPAGRKKPVAPYDELLDLDSFRNLEERHIVETEIDDCFTEEEVGQVADFLRDRYGWTIEITEIPLPVRSAQINRVGQPLLLLPDGFRAFDMQEEGPKFWDPTEEDGYALPFPLYAYWYDRHALPSVDLPMQAEQDGVRFVQSVLTRLGLNVGMRLVKNALDNPTLPEADRDRCSQALREVYDDLDLYVTRDKHSRARRVRERREAEEEIG